MGYGRPEGSRRSEEPWANDGLLITWGFRSNLSASLLLDMTPGSQEEDGQDVELAVGEIFYDPEAGVEVRLLADTSDALWADHLPPREVDRLPIIDVVSPGGDRLVAGRSAMR